MYKYDAAVVLLSNHPNGRTLPPIALSRLEKGMELYKSGQARAIGLCGSSSDKIKKYLVGLGIDENRIVFEKESTDTVGNIIMLEVLLRRFHGWNSIAIVSSDFHSERIRNIINSLYPDKFKFEVVGIEHKGCDVEGLIEHEKLSLEKFKEHFGGVKPGDDIEIISRLIDVHEGYKNRPDKNRLRSLLMNYL